MIDADRLRARWLVEANNSGRELADLLRESAVLLDSYQAGLILATPHPATGYALVQAPEHQPSQEAA